MARITTLLFRRETCQLFRFGQWDERGRCWGLPEYWAAGWSGRSWSVLINCLVMDWQRQRVGGMNVDLLCDCDYDQRRQPAFAACAQPQPATAW